MEKKEQSPKPHYWGHRKRLKERFDRFGYTCLQDYELLELILSLALPRGDVKPLAKNLLKQFKTVESILYADPALLRAFDGIGDKTCHVLKVILATHQRIAQSNIQKRDVLLNFAQVLDYCTAHMAYERIEEVRILYLDAKMGLIFDDIHSQGTATKSIIFETEIIKKAIDLGSVGLIIIHNHPSGDPTPSLADIDVTRSFQQACRVMNVQLHDHIIIGRQGHFSFKQRGLIQ